MSFIPFAVLSGVFASLSSVFAKLFSDQRTEQYHDAIVHFITNQGLLDALPLTIDTNVSLLILRGVCFGLIFVCNSLMWTLFTKALNAAPSSVQTTTVNGAVNFSVSALLGYLIFDEPLALGWWIGASMILSGTILLSRSDNKVKSD
ncbi:hypothetical protein O0I10_004354 [Lichtheimia ornata]|uniref:EamA domain-containing protein n=1 Tax=Lichtheimia ornata TaxID=688661 RepID=A0AAD7V764_9FUNG|nr:uncharacterized protein O0I10_004354 [Lichtheimia ornata]KAJ8659761.1 hypothetical protein O0I10_004354 [Lichtheimia ornata]